MMMKTQKNIFFNKKIVFGILFFLMICFSFFFFNKKEKKDLSKKIYEAAIMVRSQQNNDLAEDKKNSLKKGDVLVVQKENHNWSKIEKISYLILKMNLTQEQADKLIQPKTKKVLSENFDIEKKYEILIAREYYIDLKKEFPNFKAVDLIKNQPFIDIVYDWEIVNKKN